MPYSVWKQSSNKEVIMRFSVSILVALFVLSQASPIMAKDHGIARSASQAVFSLFSPSFLIVSSRITNFWILPVIVIGNSGTNSM